MTCTSRCLTCIRRISIPTLERACHWKHRRTSRPNPSISPSRRIASGRLWGVTTDDIVPLVSRSHLRKYQAFLATNLSFPFKARYSEPVDPAGKREIVQHVTVVGLVDRPEMEKEVGIVAEVQGATTEGLPLCNMTVTKGDPNSQPVADYVDWFLEYGYPPRWNDNELEEEREPPPDTVVRDGRVGRNDPCPCGSGKKFKKCCLKKQHGVTLD